MVHSHESRTGQQQRVLQGDTLRLFFANVGQSLLSSAQAPIPAVSIGIVRGIFPLAMGVASDRRLMGTIEHHTRYPHRKHACAPRLSCISELHWQRATRMRGPGIMSLGLTDLAGPDGEES